MGGTRIIVWKMKDLIKIGVIALVALTAIIMLVIALAGGNSNETGGGVSLGFNTGTHANFGEFLPGTYTSHIILHNKPVNVNVTVTENQITAIEMTNLLPTQELMFPLFKPTIETLSAEIIRTQSTNITLDGTAVVTSQILLDAVNAALSQARDAAAEAFDSTNPEV